MVARCQKSGKLGIAISTGVPAFGAISSQSYVNPYLGIWGFEYLMASHSARETMGILKSGDRGIDFGN